MTRFYFIRHGESEGNKLGVYVGRPDLPLTEKGREQARLTREELKSVKFDKVYSSPLSRAKETAETIGGMPATVENGFIEIDCGKWELIPFEKASADYPEEHGLWVSCFGKSCPPDGEPVAEVYRRVNEAILRLAGENPDKCLLVGSHATAILCAITIAKGKRAEEIDRADMPSNSSISIIDVEDGKVSLVQSSYDKHLGVLRTALPTNI